MRWGRRQQADPDTSEFPPVPARPHFAPVNPQAAPAPASSASRSTGDGLWPSGLPTGEIMLPGPADAAIEPLPDVAPEPHAAAEVAAAVAPAVASVVGHDAGEDDAVDPVAMAVPLEGAQPAPVSRAGRNLGLASVVGVVLAVGALVAAWWHPLAFAIAIYGFCIAAVVEWRAALARHGMHVPLAPVLTATVGMGVATWFGRGEGLVVALLVASAGVTAWRIVDDRVENTLSDSLLSILTLTWIPFLGSFMLLLELAEDGWKRILVVIIAVVLNDTFALFTGMLFGRRPLAPRVSPKKTWEGAFGGALFGTVGAAVAAGVLFDGRWWIGIAVGLAAVVAGVLGDLAESVLKRDLSVKDMSSAIPGHGGVLDRLDSMLPAAAVAYIVFALLLGTS